jgi:hypothetical protein
MRRRACLAVWVLAATVAGCARYTLGTRAYASPEAALQAQQVELATIRSGVPASRTHVGGTVRIVLPTWAQLYAAVRTSGRATDEAGWHYVATSDERGYQLMAELVRQRGAFDAVTIERGDTTSDPTTRDEDFVLWLVQPSTASAMWFVRAGGLGGRTAVPIDASLEAGAARAVRWLDVLERAALAERERARAAGVVPPSTASDPPLSVW